MKKNYKKPVVNDYKVTTKYSIADGSTVAVTDEYAESKTGTDGDALGKVREVLDGLW